MKFGTYLLLTESIQDKGILKAIFMGGSPLSGKSYITSKIGPSDIGPRIVNTDKAFEFFGNNPDKMDRTKQLTKKQLALYINSLLPIFVDGTSANPNALIRRVGLLESIGYDTGFIFVNTPLETSLKRLNQRERKVPEDVIKDMYVSTQKLKDFFKDKFNFFMEINNDDNELTDDVILKAYKKTEAFFNSGVSNPLGRELIAKMKENKWKYLTDGIYTLDFLQRLTETWYRK
jgi:predicted kinase